jgi:hypothetical protein
MKHILTNELGDVSLNRKKKILVITGIIVASLLIVIAGNVILRNAIHTYYQEAQQVGSFEHLRATFGYTSPVLANATRTYPFLLRQQGDVRFAFWSKALTGNVRLSLLDTNGQTIHSWQGRDVHVDDNIYLQRGAYTIKLSVTRYAGSLRFGLNDAQFVPTLSSDRYREVEADPSAGFHWDYILYTPETVTSPYLLVVPNNTGYPDNDIAYHRAAAKDLIQAKSRLADDLGTPLLVPIFPRPAGKLADTYTHNLDRDVLLMTVDGYRRLDLQLLAMVDDARDRLTDEQIQTQPRFLLWGFSASGTFSDRFSLLHPGRLAAVAAGGCTHSLPLATYAGENLPYPVGTYDYETITGAPFDAEAFAALPRFLYKGGKDTGGTITTDDGVYPADEYFDQFERPKLEAELASSPSPLITGADLSPTEEALLKYRIYEGAAFVNEFIAAREIYAEAGIDASTFTRYPDAGHEITDAMEQDIRAFFLAAMQ